LTRILPNQGGRDRMREETYGIQAATVAPAVVVRFPASHLELGGGSSESVTSLNLPDFAMRNTANVFEKLCSSFGYGP
jgi:hypothetical protein